MISNSDWLSNDKRFREAYAPTVLIMVLWRQIYDADAYANAGSTPYFNKQVMDNTYQFIFNTGIFAADCWEWNKWAADDNMLPHFKVFFVAVHRDWRLLIQNKTGAPYGAAYNATANLYDGYLQQETVDAIANLEIATASYRAAIAQITSTVERLTADLVILNSKLVTALQT